VECLGGAGAKGFIQGRAGVGMHARCTGKHNFISSEGKHLDRGSTVNSHRVSCRVVADKAIGVIRDLCLSLRLGEGRDGMNIFNCIVLSLESESHHQDFLYPDILVCKIIALASYDSSIFRKHSLRFVLSNSAYRKQGIRRLHMFFF